MTPKLNSAIAVIGIDIGKNSFHVVGHDQRGAIVLWQKWSRGQVETRPVQDGSRVQNDVFRADSSRMRSRAFDLMLTRCPPFALKILC